MRTMESKRLRKQDCGYVFSKHAENQSLVVSVHADGCNDNRSCNLCVCFCVQTAPPRNISVSVGETAVNLSWVTPERQRNIGFHIRYLRKNGKSFEWPERKRKLLMELLSCSFI